MYQIFQVINIDNSLLFTFSSTPSTRGHNYKLYEPFAHRKACYNFFGVRTINVWNNLPHDIVNATSLSIFKNKLDEHWKDISYAHNS